MFECIAYSHVPYQPRKKFDGKGEKCLLIDYCRISKVYKIYHLKTNKVILVNSKKNAKGKTIMVANNYIHQNDTQTRQL